MQIKKLNLEEIKEVGDSFLSWNNSLKELNLPNLVTAGDFCLYQNCSLTYAFGKVHLPKLAPVRYGCYFWNFYNKTLMRRQESNED